MRREPAVTVSFILWHNMMVKNNLLLFNLDEIYIKPQVRELIEKESKVKMKDDTPEAEEVIEEE